MTEPTKPAAEGPRKPPRDPFLEPLDGAQVREFFRRLEARPHSEQRGFIDRMNWNLLDPAIEYRVFGWLLKGLRSDDAARQAHAIAVLDKMPHFRRGKQAPRFRPHLAEFSPELARQVADAFGPVLGGAPKRPAGKANAQAPARNVRPAAPKAASLQPEAPAREASATELESLKSFFDKFGGTR